MTLKLLAALAALALAGPALAQAPGQGQGQGQAQPSTARKPDPGVGEIIAKRWCASCHLVAPDQTRANVDAPTFSAIAAKKMDDDALTAFLQTPHPRMPDMSLTRNEVSDLVAFITHLGPK